jgi:hypothetical protein
MRIGQRKVVKLLETSERSWVIRFGNEINRQAIAPRVDWRRPRGLEGKRCLALLISGKFNSAFSHLSRPPAVDNEEKIARGSESLTAGEKKPEDDKKKEEEQREVLKESVPTQIIVVGDSEFLLPAVWRTALREKGGISRTDNVNFFLNCVDYLLQEEDLIAIRTKRVTDRPVKELSSRARGWYHMFCYGLVPVLIFVVGFSRFLIRRQRKRAYLELYRRIAGGGEKR